MDASNTADSVPAALRVRELMTAGLLAQAVYVLCDLEVPDHLDTPRASTEIAKEVGADAEGLLPFLRAACAAGVMTEPEPRVFGLTEVGRVLRTDAPNSMAKMCSLTGREEFNRTWSAAGHTARTGQPSFPAVYGMTFFEYMKTNREFATLFDKAMVSSAAIDNLLAGYDFSRARHVVDVGGGRGAMLAAVLRSHPHLQGTLVDLPHVVAAAGPVLEEAGVADRVTLAPGSFFDPLPDSGDVYLLSRVIGNWNDADSLRILRNVRSVMGPDDRMVIVGQTPSENDRTNYPRQLDLYMFALLGARLRSYAEYREFFEQEGLEAVNWANFPDSESVIEARAI